MNNILVGIMIVAIGCWLIIKRETFNNTSLDFQRKVFGLNFSKKFTGKIIIPFGILLIVLGVLVVLGLSDEVLPKPTSY